ncbi:putative Anion exchange transporter protein, partial [Naja naja]
FCSLTNVQSPRLGIKPKITQISIHCGRKGAYFLISRKGLFIWKFLLLPEGNVDPAFADLRRSSLQQHPSERHNLIFDCSGLTFFDYTASLKKALKFNGKLELENAVFYESVSSAVAAIQFSRQSVTLIMVKRNEQNTTVFILLSNITGITFIISPLAHIQKQACEGIP